MDKKNLWFFLFRLAELGAVKKPVFTSTIRLAEKFNCSQQTASRILKTLSLEGYVERRVNVRGEYVKITGKGLEELRRIHTILTKALYPTKPVYLKIKGKVFTGLGEGSYYVTRNGYLKQFIGKLGFKPYPGTLNLKLLSQTDLTVRKELENLPGIEIEGFRDGERTYGPLKCFPTVVDGKVKGAVLLIGRTHYNSSVIEVIAPVCLRKKLKVKDGDIVSLKIET